MPACINGERPESGRLLVRCTGGLTVTVTFSRGLSPHSPGFRHVHRTFIQFSLAVYQVVKENARKFSKIFPASRHFSSPLHHRRGFISFYKGRSPAPGHRHYIRTPADGSRPPPGHSTGGSPGSPPDCPGKYCCPPTIGRSGRWAADRPG